MLRLLPELMGPIIGLLGSGADGKNFFTVLSRNRAMAVTLLRTLQQQARDMFRLTAEEQAEVDAGQLSVQTADMVRDAAIFIADFQQRANPGAMSRIGYEVIKMLSDGLITGWTRWNVAYRYASQFNRLLGMVTFTQLFWDCQANIRAPLAAPQHQMEMDMSIKWGRNIQTTLDAVPAFLFVNSLNLSKAAPPVGSNSNPRITLASSTLPVGLPPVDGVLLDMAFGGYAAPRRQGTHLQLPPRWVSRARFDKELPVSLEVVDPTRRANPAAADVALVRGTVCVTQVEEGFIVVNFAITECNLDALVAVFADIVHAGLMTEYNVGETYPLGVLRRVHEQLINPDGRPWPGSDESEDSGDYWDGSPAFLSVDHAATYGVHDVGQTEEADAATGRRLALSRVLRLFGPVARYLSKCKRDYADMVIVRDMLFGRPAAPEPTATPQPPPPPLQHHHLQCASCRAERAILVAVDPETHESFCATCAPGT